MSKPLSYHYWGTKGHIVEIASHLTKDPEKLIADGWYDLTDPRAELSSNSRLLREVSSGLIIRFDRGTPGEKGFGGMDHYHIFNPDAKDKKIGRYLDKDGNPVNKNSKASHIIPKEKK